jgi:MYXO-CTERM domain-containing protein
MPEQPGELAEGVGLLHLGVPEDHVEALYGPIEHPAETCAAAPLCLTLRHPSVALAGDRLVGPFALRVEGLGEVASEGLVDGISARLRSETGFDPWTVSRVTPVATGTADSPEARAEDETDPRPWALAALLLTMGLVWAWRRRRPSP